MIGAMACTGKSTAKEEYSDKIVERVVTFLDSLGYPRISLKSDRENAMRALQRRVQLLRSGETVLNNSPSGDSQSNGMIERAIQDIEEVIRAQKVSTEERIGVVVPPKHLVLEWLI